MWSRWPNEIEADLLAIGVDIAHWHRLTIDPETGCPRLSSRRLLVLLDKLPDCSEFKKSSERDGRQSRAERVAEDTYNETALLRASFHAAHGGREAAYEPFRYRDPIDEKLRADKQAQEANEDVEAAQRFESEIGFA